MNLVANKKVTIKLSTNTGKISGEGNVSGIASTISNEKIVIEDCKNNNSTYKIEFQLIKLSFSAENCFLNVQNAFDAKSIEF